MTPCILHPNEGCQQQKLKNISEFFNKTLLDADLSFQIFLQHHTAATDFSRLYSGQPFIKGKKSKEKRAASNHATG